MKHSGTKSAAPRKADKVRDDGASVAATQGDRDGGHLFPIIGIGASAGGLEALEVFFRDGEVWNTLRDTVIPDLIRQRTAGGDLRAWVAGCSTGEEAYSLAMVFLEAAETVKPEHPVSLQIFATDVDQDAINRARTGQYPQGIAKDVPEARLERFFTSEENGYRVIKKVRDMVVFAQQNIVSDAPFTKLDILCCRNLLIYLVAEFQRKLLPLFHYCLNPGGVLILGSAETIGPATQLFSPLAGTLRMFRRLETRVPLGRMHFPVAFGQLPLRGAAGGAAAGDREPAPDLKVLANEFLLRNCTPAAVLASVDGDILYIHGKTGSYLEPAAGKANWNLFAMAREELSHAVFEVFQRALRKKDRVVLKGVRLASRLDYPGLAEDTRQVLRTLTPLRKEVPSRDGRWFAVRIVPYRTRESMIDGLVLTFLDVSDARKGSDELRACQPKLQTLDAGGENEKGGRP